MLVVYLIADACLVRNIQFAHERGEVETADTLLQLVLPSDVRRKSEDRSARNLRSRRVPGAEGYGSRGGSRRLRGAIINLNWQAREPGACWMNR
jgi:hypothetical protein